MVQMINDFQTQGPVDLSDLSQISTQGRNAQEMVLDIMAKLRENIVLRRAVNIPLPSHYGLYTHGKVPPSYASNRYDELT